MEDHRINNDIIKLQSIIHQEALCATVSTLKSVIDIVVKAMNFIFLRGLKHRQFGQLLLQREICIKICFISATHVGLVEMKCYED